MSAKQIVTQAATVAELFAEAKAIWNEVGAIEGRLRLTRDELLMLGHQMGGKLAAIKDLVTPGNWTLWRESHWPELSERDAQRCVSLWKSNPEAADSAGLSVDSQRAYLWHYVPDKERPELPGDKPLKPITHPLTLTNTFRKMCRQMEMRGMKIDKEEAKEDLRPLFDWLCELYEVQA